jgi:hypothetical protein
LDDFIHGLFNNQSIVRRQRNKRVGPAFDKANLLGIDYEFVAIQTREFDHLRFLRFSPLGPLPGVSIVACCSVPSVPHIQRDAPNVRDPVNASDWNPATREKPFLPKSVTDRERVIHRPIAAPN